MIFGWEHWWEPLIAFGAAFGAGVINALAGGGTLLTFPTLVFLGVPPIGANVTSAIALWPGRIGGAWGFRREILAARHWWLWLGVPSLLGGILGAILLINLPSEIFAAIAPYLVLSAAGVMLLQGPIKRFLHTRPGEARSTRQRLLAAGVQFVIATYGGYFGAGLGILVLAALGLLGVRDLHRANGLKNLFGVAIKGVAVTYFIATRTVFWNIAILMAVGAIAGGYAGGAFGHRIGERPMRVIIVAAGLSMALAMLLGLA